MTGIGEPEAGEYAPFFESYVARVRGRAIVTTLEEQAGTIRGVLAAVPEARAGFRYAEGKWTIREVVGHWTDAERVFSYRALAFARGEKAPLPAFDENEFARIAAHDTIPLGEIASGKPVTVRALAFIMGGHVAHHLAALRERYGVGG